MIIIDIPKRIEVFEAQILGNPRLPLEAKLSSMYRISKSAIRAGDGLAVREIARLWMVEVQNLPLSFQPANVTYVELANRIATILERMEGV